MTRAWLALLLFACPVALSQPVEIRCDKTHCVVSVEVLKMLLARGELNCGPIR